MTVTIDGKSIYQVTKLTIEEALSFFEHLRLTEQEKKIADKLLEELCSWGLMDGKLIESGVHPDMPIALILVNEFIRSSGGVA